MTTHRATWPCLLSTCLLFSREWPLDWVPGCEPMPGPVLVPPSPQAAKRLMIQLYTVYGNTVLTKCPSKMPSFFLTSRQLVAQRLTAWASVTTSCTIYTACCSSVPLGLQVLPQSWHGCRVPTAGSVTSAALCPYFLYKGSHPNRGLSGASEPLFIPRVRAGPSSIPKCLLC